MKILDKDNLQYLVNLIKNNIRVVEEKYFYATEQSEVVTMSIPNFDVNVMSVEVFLNGFYQIETTDYDIVGPNVVFKKEIIADQDIHIVVKKIEI